MPKRDKTSIVWQYFTDTDKTRSIATCDTCGKQLSYKGSTTNLAKHIQNVHPTVEIKRLHSTRAHASKETKLLLTDVRQITMGPTRKRTAVLWQYFTDIDRARSIAKCDTCGRLLSYRTTTANLVKHFRTAHSNLQMKRLHSPRTQDPQEYLDSKVTKLFTSDDEVTQDEQSITQTSEEYMDSKVSTLPEEPISDNEVIQKEQASKETSLLLTDVRHEAMPPIVRRDRTSIVWQYFTDTDKARSIAQCDVCGKKLSYRTTTTNLSRHFKKAHPTVQIEKIHSTRSQASQEYVDSTVPTWLTPRNEGSQEEPRRTRASQEFVDSKVPTWAALPAPDNEVIQKEPISPKFVSSISCETASENEIIEDESKPSAISPMTKKQLLNVFCELFYIDFKPFSIVEDRGFRNFVKALNPNFEIPSKNHISRVLIPAAYAKCMEDAKTMAAKIRGACLTTHARTSLNEDSSNAITAHFIDENFILKRLLLESDALSSQHTADDLAEEMNKVVTDWDLSGIICLVTTDNAPNITCAISERLKWNHWTCFSDTLDLIVRDGLKRCETPIAKIRAIVKFFKRSPVATLKLSEEQGDIGVVEKKLLEDVGTHWCSVFHMLERISELELPVKSVLNVVENNLQLPTYDEWLNIEDLIKILKPFEIATKAYTGGKYFPASLVIVLSNGLLDVCKNLRETTMSSSPMIMEVLNDFITSINKRLSNVENNEILSLCTFLDPRFKIFPFNSSEAAERAKSAAVNEVCSIIETDQGPYTYNISTDDEKETESNDNGEFSIWRALSRKVNTECDKFKGTPKSRSFLEIQRYMEDEVLDRRKDPLEWWRNKRHQYPYLSQVVRLKFCAMGTTIPCERLFATAGLVLSQKKSMLNSEMIKKLFFLNVNNSFMKQ